MALIFVNMIRYPHTLKNNIYHSSKLGPLPLFHLDTSIVLGHILIHSVDKTHLLVVIVELIWLLFSNILSFNLVLRPNKSLWFTWFRRSYVNCPAVILIKVDVRCFSWFAGWWFAKLICLMSILQSSNFPFFFFLFCSCLSPVIVYLHNLFL